LVTEEDTYLHTYAYICPYSFMRIQAHINTYVISLLPLTFLTVLRMRMNLLLSNDIHKFDRKLLCCVWACSDRAY